MTVSPAGAITISLGGKLVSDGRWSLIGYPNAPANSDELPLVQATTTTFQDSPGHAVVTDTYPSAIATFDITLKGEDLRFLLHLQNLDQARTIKQVNLQGLTLHFAHPADGTLASWHGSYLAARGLSIYHPSLEQPVGTSYARDERFGVGMCSLTEFDRQSLFNADWVKDGVIPADSHINLFTTRQVPAGQSVDVDANFRISSDTSMKHLDSIYKQAYDQHHPALAYHADQRPMAGNFAVDVKAISRSNPYGFVGPVHRLDSAVGVSAYVRLLAPPLQRANALGIIFWAPGGVRPVMYPPDFDVLPEAVRRNIPALVDGFLHRGLRVGMCARCGDGVISEPGKPPVLYRLSAGNPDDMRILRERFTHVMDLGFDMFYLDSFGADFANDLPILKQVRDWVGPDVLMYTETCTDASLPYAGHYCEWIDGGILFTNRAHFDELKYLCPDSTWLCRAKTGRTVPLEFARLGLVPIVEDMQSNRLPASQPSK